MASYLIYIPRGVGSRAELLERAGLADLLLPGDSGPVATEVIERGPDGGSGVILTWRGTDGPRLGHHPDYQVWEPAEVCGTLPAGRYWYGYEPARPPRPNDLARTTQLPGFELTLGDGQAWRIPNAVRLPHRFLLDAAGHEIREIRPDYLTIYGRAMEVFGLLERHLQAGDPLPGPQIRDYLAWMLSHNYRINRELCYRLRLWDDENWIGAAEATVDFLELERIEADVKKKATASTPATWRPGDGDGDSDQSISSPHYST